MIDAKKIKEELIDEIKNITDSKTLYDIRVKYIGKKGIISELVSNLGKLSIEEKKEIWPYY